MSTRSGAKPRLVDAGGPGPRRSRTRFVILGMLSIGSASAYALRQRIASSVGFFWQESFGQLFPALAALEKEGLVKGRSARDGKRRRRDYEITAAGRAVLKTWLREPPTPQPERNELLLKVFFANPSDPGALGAFIANADDAARADLDELRGIEVLLKKKYAADPRLAYWSLTLRYGILGSEALRHWCKEALRVTESG